MPDSLTIEILEQGQTVRVIVDGEVDLSAARDFDAAIAQAGAMAARTIVLDLDHVSFLDATGLGLIARHALAGEYRDRIRLTPGSRPVRHLLELTGMDGRLRSL